MPLRVSNLRLPVDEPDEKLPAHLARVLAVTTGDLGAWRVVRKALDVRDKQSLRFVYNVELESPGQDNRQPKHSSSATVERIADDPFTMPPSGTIPLPHRPVVVGSGPAGLVCAYFLAKHGYRPLVLERGTKVNDRIKAVKAFDEGGSFEPESNYLFGGTHCNLIGKQTTHTGTHYIRIV